MKNIKLLVDVIWPQTPELHYSTFPLRCCRHGYLCWIMRTEFVSFWFCAHTNKRNRL